MNSWEHSRREELRENLRGLARRILPFLVVFGAGVGVGLWIDRPSRVEDTTQLALDQNADSLRVVRSIADSLKHVDSVQSAAVLTRRPLLRHASNAIQVVPHMGDSLIVIQRPTATADHEALPTTTADTVALPPIVVTFIREAKLQLAADSVLLHVKDLRIATLEKADSLSRIRDSLHVEREQEFQTQRDAAWRRGFKTGVKVVVVTAAIIGGAAKLISIAK